jgi:hypothetical protein
MKTRENRRRCLLKGFGGAKASAFSLIEKVY